VVGGDSVGDSGRRCGGIRAAAAPRRGGVVYAEPDDEILEHGDAARDDDPFGLPPVDTDLTPEQRAELEAAERAVLDQQREAEE